VLLTDMLGVATGAGLGGGMIAIASATGAPVTAGLAGAFALGIAAMLVLLVLAPRIPGGPVRPEVPGPKTPTPRRRQAHDGADRS
jgi:hypothetical protein